MVIFKTEGECLRETVRADEELICFAGQLEPWPTERLQGNNHCRQGITSLYKAETYTVPPERAPLLLSDTAWNHALQLAQPMTGPDVTRVAVLYSSPNDRQRQWLDIIADARWRKPRRPLFCLTRASWTSRRALSLRLSFKVCWMRITRVPDNLLAISQHAS